MTTKQELQKQHNLLKAENGKLLNQVARLNKELTNIGVAELKVKVSSLESEVDSLRKKLDDSAIEKMALSQSVLKNKETEQGLRRELAEVLERVEYHNNRNREISTKLDIVKTLIQDIYL